MPNHKSSPNGKMEQHCHGHHDLACVSGPVRLISLWVAHHNLRWQAVEIFTALKGHQDYLFKFVRAGWSFARHVFGVPPCSAMRLCCSTGCCHCKRGSPLRKTSGLKGLMIHSIHHEIATDNCWWQLHDRRKHCTQVTIVSRFLCHTTYNFLKLAKRFYTCVEAPLVMQVQHVVLQAQHNSSAVLGCHSVPSLHDHCITSFVDAR